MDNKIKLIVLEGHDRTGKDTLLNDLKNDNRFIVYKQPETEDQPVDYKNPEEFKKFMIKWIRKVLDDLYSITRSNKDKIVVMSRLWITDNVFADIYNRGHVVEKYFLNEIKTNFNVHNFCMLWKDYQKYVDRMNFIRQPIEFNEKEFDKITERFQYYLTGTYLNDESDYIYYILNDTTKEDIYNKFINYIESLWK